MLTIREAAERLKVSDDTIRRRIKSGELPAYKPTRKYVIKQSDLNTFLESRHANGGAR